MLAFPAVGRGESQSRFAVLISNNTGQDPARSLHYAEADAMRLRDVLVDLGGFPGEHVTLVTGQNAAVARTALARVFAAASSAPGGATVLVYYSGPATPAGLELGSSLLPFDELRRWAREGAGTTRILVIDP